MKGIVTSGGALTPRQSKYARTGGWVGLANWIRDKVLVPLSVAMIDPPDSLSGDEFRTNTTIAAVGNTTILNPQSYNIEVLEISLFFVTQNVWRIFIGDTPATPQYNFPDSSAISLPPFTLKAGKPVIINVQNANTVNVTVRWRYVQPLGTGEV